MTRYALTATRDLLRRLGSRTLEGLNRFRHEIAAGILGGLVVTLIAWAWLFHLSDRFFALAERDQWDIGVKIAGGVLVLAGFALTAWRITVSDRQVQAIEDGLVTERFTRAIAQLGERNQDASPNLEVRLGGIYALERLAKDSSRDWWTVMEVLSAYVRENAPWREEEGSEGSLEEQPKEDQPVRPRVDVQAVLTAIGRRSAKVREPGGIDFRRTNLRGADLSMADLRRAHLEEANLARANLQKADLAGVSLAGASLQKADLAGASLAGAYLQKANLAGANLQKANLTGASLAGAYLQKANLAWANLAGAYLWKAHLKEARLVRANLPGTNLMEANLTGTEDCTFDQLAEAIVDEDTILPEHLESRRNELLDRSKENRLTRAKDCTFDQLAEAIIDETTILPEHLGPRRNDLLDRSKKNLAQLEEERKKARGEPTR